MIKLSIITRHVYIITLLLRPYPREHQLARDHKHTIYTILKVGLKTAQTITRQQADWRSNSSKHTMKMITVQHLSDRVMSDSSFFGCIDCVMIREIKQSLNYLGFCLRLPLPVLLVLTLSVLKLVQSPVVLLDLFPEEWVFHLYTR